MKKPLPFFRGLEGTIMIFSLFIILGGTLVLAAWVQMLATRATYTATTEEGQKRRIAMENGRALARQYVLNQMPNANSFLGTNYSLADGWGGFSLQVPPDNPWLTTNFSVGNPFNPISDDSFVVAISGSNTYICNSAETNRWTFFVRSRSPILAGFPAVFHLPTTISDTGQFTNVTTYKIYGANLTNLVGRSNTPDIPFTSGYTASNPGATNAYLGYFASPMNTNYPSPVDVSPSALSVVASNSLGATFSSTSPGPNTNTLVTNYRGGSVTLGLNSTQTDSITRYDIPNTVTNIWSTTNPSGTKTIILNYSNSAVTNLMLVASANTNALHLTVNSTNTNLTLLTLRGTNNTRRVYCSMNGSQNLTLKTESRATNYSWWMGLTAANTNLDLNITAPTNTRSLTITGGIRTERGLAVDGRLNIVSNSVPAISGTNVSGIEFIADRILWLEEQKSTNQ
jgi:hypothetical protein